MLSLLIKLALVFVLASMARAQNGTIIYMDYTSGFSTILPVPIVNAVAEHTYNTNLPGSYRFGVDWNNDLTDQFTIDAPQTVTVTTTVAFCMPSSATTPPNQITFTASTIHQCNYSVTWTAPFSGVLTVTYNGGPNTGNIRSDAISTFFQNTSVRVVGDPQFVGLRGQSYQVHGIDGAVYNIISEKNLQVNSRFVFLNKGDCPLIEGVADTNCWSHPGSYMGELSFQQRVEGQLHAILVTAGSAKKGFSMVQMDGKALKVGDKVAFGSFSLSMSTSHKVTVQSDNFEFDLTNSDLFINQGVRAKVALSKLTSHGLLGQTHSSTLHSSPLRFIEGDVDDYAVADNDVFGDDFVYNQFQA